MEAFGINAHGEVDILQVQDDDMILCASSLFDKNGFNTGNILNDWLELNQGTAAVFLPKEKADFLLGIIVSAFMFPVLAESGFNITLKDGIVEGNTIQADTVNGFPTLEEYSSEIFDKLNIAVTRKQIENTIQLFTKPV